MEDRGQRMHANARATDPPTSQDAAAFHNAIDPNKPSAELQDSVIVAAIDQTREKGAFTDSELTDRAVPHMRLVHKIKCKDNTSSVRRARKWLSENVLSGRKTVCIVAAEGKRNGERLWKYVDDKPQPVAKQQDLFE